VISSNIVSTPVAETSEVAEAKDSGSPVEDDAEKKISKLKIKQAKQTILNIKSGEVKLPPSTIPQDVAPLFGKGSEVRLELNSDIDGGTLNFIVDGEPLDITITGVYKKLGKMSKNSGVQFE
jgi:hypothetical protein